MHAGYETVQPYPVEECVSCVLDSSREQYRVEKMRYAGKPGRWDKTALIYNERITLRGIPIEAQEYVVNGKPALDWVINQYRYYVSKESGLTDDPNLWSDDPRYIVDLVQRVIRVSADTARLVSALPKEYEDNGKV
jgi:predicted helicase